MRDDRDEITNRRANVIATIRSGLFFFIVIPHYNAF